MSEFPTTAQRIWVVDDDRAVRFVLCTALREAGYQVVDFDSAAAALQALGEGAPPALLFTDVRMPGDDGLVLLDKLKAALPQLPVVVMSVSVMPVESLSAMPTPDVPWPSAVTLVREESSTPLKSISLRPAPCTVTSSIEKPTSASVGSPLSSA